VSPTFPVSDLKSTRCNKGWNCWWLRQGKNWQGGCGGWTPTGKQI